jgi:hypothetical protein
MTHAVIVARPDKIKPSVVRLELLTAACIR